MATGRPTKLTGLYPRTRVGGESPINGPTSMNQSNVHSANLTTWGENIYLVTFLNYCIDAVFKVNITAV